MIMISATVTRAAAADAGAAQAQYRDGDSHRDPAVRPARPGPESRAGPGPSSQAESLTAPWPRTPVNRAEKPKKMGYASFQIVNSGKKARFVRRGIESTPARLNGAAALTFRLLRA